MACTDGRDQVDDATRLFDLVDLVTGACLDPTDINDPRTLGHRLVHALQCRVEPECPRPGKKGVGRAVDDGHDHEFIRAERART